jgi:hypothetical protein
MEVFCSGAGYSQGKIDGSGNRISLDDIYQRYDGALPVLEYALHSIEKQLQALKDIFESDRFPVPVGFIDKDVDAKAARLFSDGFALQYVKNMAMVGLPVSAMALVPRLI